MRRVTRSLVQLAMLALPFGCSKTDPIQGTPPPAAPAPGSQVYASDGVKGNARYPAPQLDLPAERLSERVDGAEVKLRALGCRRLRLWQLRELSAELELLSFSTEKGALTLLAEQAGAERSVNVPGDEGWIGSNALYFRHGSTLVRLIADAPTQPDALLMAARRMEQALTQGEVLP